MDLAAPSILSVELLQVCWFKGWTGLSHVRKQKDKGRRDFKRNANSSSMAPKKTVPVFTEGQISCGRGQGLSNICIALRSSALCRCILLCLSKE